MLFGEVPALPVLAPLAAVASVLLLWRLHRRGQLTVLRALMALGVCLYGTGVIANTVFPIFLDKPGEVPPWSMAVNLIPFAGYELPDAMTNVIVFVPLGLFLALVLGIRSLWRVAFWGALLSLFIELAQLFSDHFFAGGHIADVNDFFFNVVGAAVGYGLATLALRVPVLERCARRLNWSSAPAENKRPSDDEAVAPVDPLV